MSEYRTVATYMGFTCQAYALDRKPGVTPDTGWVELATEEVGVIRILQDLRLWQAAGVKEPAGPWTVAAAKRILRATVTGLPEAKVLRRGGPLIITTFDDDRQVDQVRLEPMFIAPSGIEEKYDDMEDALLHNHGVIRINVTDFRHFWQKNGTPMFGRVNMTLGNGRFDERTIDQQTGKPFTLADVMNAVALALPGSPSIHPKSDVFDEREPVNLDMKLELPVEWLSRLLDAYNMESHLTHNSQLFIKRRGRQHQVRRFRSSPDSDPKPLPVAADPEHPNVEKKTVFVIDRPEGVTVVGGRRQRRVVSQCEPVFIDVDGSVRRMSDLPVLWGYSVDDAQLQMAVESSKQFDDIPGEQTLKFKRIKIAQRDFFKLYAPSMLFQNPVTIPGGDGGARPPVRLASEYWPFDRIEHPLLPVLDPRFLASEAPVLHLQAKATIRTPVNPSNETLVERPILARGNLIAQRTVTDASGIQKIASANASGKGAAIDKLQRELAQKRKELVRVLNLKKEDEFKHLGSLDQFKVTVKKAADDNVMEALALVSTTAEQVLQRVAQARAYREQDRTRIEGEIQNLQAQIGALARESSAVRTNLLALTQAIKDFGGVRLWVNVPWGAVDEGSFDVDRKFGLVRFSEVMGSIATAGVEDLENVPFVGDGHVEITYSAEVRLDSPTEFSTWTFKTDENGEIVDLNKISDISALKPTVVRDEGLVIYENEAGQPMNIDTVTQKAARMAKALLNVPSQQVGYNYLYPGAWKVITDDSVNQVSWTSDGDESHTSIVANNPEIDTGFASLARKRHEEEIVHGRRPV
jgi:hypothetical protein